MLLKLLVSDFQLPTLFLFQQLSGVLEGVFEEVGSFLFFPVPALMDALSSAKKGQSLPDLHPQCLQSLFLCLSCFPPVLTELSSSLYQLANLLFSPSFLPRGSSLLVRDFAEPALTLLV